LNTKEGSNSLFCSELVAYIFQGIGLLEKYADGGTIPNEFSPCDFSSQFTYKLPLIGGHLGEEVMFGFPPDVPVSPPLELSTSSDKGKSGSGKTESPTSHKGMPSSTMKYFNRALQKRPSSSSSQEQTS